MNNPIIFLELTLSKEVSTNFLFLFLELLWKKKVYLTKFCKCYNTCTVMKLITN